VRDEHQLGLRALERPQCLAVPEDAAVVALVKLAAAAEKAAATGRAITAQYPVALGHLGHARARGHDRSDELVTEREARLDHHAAVVDVQVGPAHARCLHPHHGVVALDEFGLGAVLDPDLAGRLEGHGLHPSGTL
jgi:hypothetical protein